jgi:Spy/CpxP family protein refolding chaperone
LFEEFQKSLKEVGNTPSDDKSDSARLDRQARQKLYKERQEKLFDDVIAVLTPEQKAKVEETLKGKNRRPERGPRGERPNGDEPNGEKPEKPANDRG